MALSVNRDWRDYPLEGIVLIKWIRAEMQIAVAMKSSMAGLGFSIIN